MSYLAAKNAKVAKSMKPDTVFSAFFAFFAAIKSAAIKLNCEN